MTVRYDAEINRERRGEGTGRPAHRCCAGKDDNSNLTFGDALPHSTIGPADEQDLSLLS